MSAASLQASLDALRRSGAESVAPARMRHADAMLRRMQRQPEAVRGVLEARLAQLLAELAARVDEAPRQAPPAAVMPRRVVTKVKAPPAPRGALAVLAARERPSRELASVARFRDAWSAQRALEHVAAASRRQPANAGPLNSESLVLQSLALMEQLSPQYLRRFVSHVEALQWLEQAAASAPARKAAPRKKSRP